MLAVCFNVLRLPATLVGNVEGTHKQTSTIDVVATFTKSL